MSDTHGNQRRWYDILPASWVPYMELCHISTPAGVLLIYFPHLYGALYVSITQGRPLPEVLQICSVLLGGTLFFSNAGHAWNDIIDAPIDGLIPRTKNRPIPRGAVSPRNAFIFVITQAIGAIVFLLMLPREAAPCTIPSIVATAYYPWAKRHTHFTQFVLAFCLAWGVMVGASAMNIEQPWTNESLVCIFIACSSWAIIYDTTYSHMDVRDDVKIGVKSMAVLLRDRTKFLLWGALACMIVSLVRCGSLSGFSYLYGLIAAGGCLVSQGLMIFKVDLKKPETCWWWFANGFWGAGWSITAGLVLEYLMRTL
ncbi:UbiA prenyltransferase family-domain-containing protein [Hypomontagnella monticulosa]|nr:UbiA prenyltransferase family-domain-containing protein [Hypomontagnella monticulosa]